MSACHSPGSIIYICQSFPRVTQAFTVREITTLEDFGLDIRVVSFRKPGDAVSSSAHELVSRTTYLPSPLSPSLMRGALVGLARRPHAFLMATAEALTGRGLLRTPWSMRARGVLAVARGAWIAGRFPDALLFHAEFADEAATAAMTAGVLTQRPFSFKSHASFNPQLLGLKARRAAFVATESEFTRRYYFSDLPDARVLINRGGILLPAERKRGQRSGPESTLSILSIGTLQEKKGLHYLLSALGQLRDAGTSFRCLIVGSGPLETRLRMEVKQWQLDDIVSIEPYRSHSDIIRLYESYDVFVLPCIVTDDGDRDGIPAVLIEAGAFGCALVSTPVSGIPELIRDGRSGILVPERDDEALAAALSRLAKEPDLRERLGKAARLVVEQEFNLRRNVMALAERFAAETGA